MYAVVLLVVCSKTIAEQSINQDSNKIQWQSFFGSVQFGSVQEALHEAERLRDNDDLSSGIALANQIIAQASDELELAKSHAFLAQLYTINSELDAAQFHHLRASIKYKSLDHQKEHIENALAYASIDLISFKRYQDGYETFITTLREASEYGDSTLMAQGLNIKGKILYDQKKYHESAIAYNDAISHLDKNEPDSLDLLGSSYHQLGQIFKQRKDYESASEHHKQALHFFQLSGNKELLKRAYKNVAIVESRRKNFVTSLDYVINGLYIDGDNGKSKEDAELLLLGGSTYRSLNRYPESLEYLIKANKLYLELNNIGRIADTSNQIGYLYTRLKQFDQARSFYQSSIDLPSESVPGKVLASAYRELSVIEKNGKNYEQAMIFAKNAHQIFVAMKDDAKASRTARIIADLYVAMDLSEQGIVYYEKSLQLATLSDDSASQVKVMNKLARILLKSDRARAMKLYNSSLEIAIEDGFSSEQLAAYEGMLKIAVDKKDFEKAFSYSEMMRKLAKSIFEKREADRLSQAKAVLDSHKIETELTSLKEKAKLDQVSLEKQNNDIEIAKQANIIASLELEKKQYANLFLTIGIFTLLAMVIYIAHNFAKSRKKNMKLDYLASHDHLTQCLNRRGLLESIEEMFKETVDMQFCIIMVDIDNFKEVNDRHGHDVGDEVLIGIVETVKSNIGKSDILARYGGEEFCILMPNEPIKSAAIKTEKIRQSIENETVNGVSVTCSFGISEQSKVVSDTDILIKQADKALYHSKQEGRNRVTLYKAGM